MPAVTQTNGSRPSNVSALVGAAKKINQRTHTGFWLVVPRQVTGVPDNFDSRIAHVGLYALHAGYRAKPIPIALNKQRWNAETLQFLFDAESPVESHEAADLFDHRQPAFHCTGKTSSNASTS